MTAGSSDEGGASPPPSPGSVAGLRSIKLVGVFDLVKRLLVGRPLRSARRGDTLLPKRIALAVFCSDPISSVAYATEQIVLVLAAGGLVALRSTPWIGLVVALLLVTVVVSYRQTCFAYHSGGGAYVVSRENLGEGASLAAAAALLVDYVMTVAVSVTSGVVAVTSAFPTLSPYATPMAVGLIAILALANLRGTKESGRAFAVPTYAFVGLTLLMFCWAPVKAATSGLPPASTAVIPVPNSTGLAGLALALALVRAFASGCTMCLSAPIIPRNPTVVLRCRLPPVHHHFGIDTGAICAVGADRVPVVFRGACARDIRAMLLLLRLRADPR